MKGQVEDQFHEAMDTLCPCGVKSYSEAEVEAVDF